jgi:NADPH:quinone reductase-like Zn-dependent oxidoreductase
VEGAGEVAATGPGVDPSLMGQRVAFWAMPPAVSGTYATARRHLIEWLEAGELELSILAALSACRSHY